jgi:hypothetical protein
MYSLRSYLFVQSNPREERKQAANWALLTATMASESVTLWEWPIDQSLASCCVANGKLNYWRDAIAFSYYGGSDGWPGPALSLFSYSWRVPARIPYVRRSVYFDAIII